MAELLGDLKKLQVLFWTQLLDRARKKGVLYHDECKHFETGVLSTGTGRTGLTYEYQIFVREAAAVQLYFSHGDADVNWRRHEFFRSRQSELEEKLGMPLVFHPEPTEREAKCRSIQGFVPGRGLRDAGDEWPELQEQMIDTMDSFVKVLRPYIDDMPI